LASCRSSQQPLVPSCSHAINYVIHAKKASLGSVGPKSQAQQALYLQ
jgi:hypothetical protein